MAIERRGAEAVVEIGEFEVVKMRVEKHYRIKELDDRLRSERTRAEAKIISEARKLGIPTPIIYDVGKFDLVMECIHGEQLKSSSTRRTREKRAFSSANYTPAASSMAT